MTNSVLVENGVVIQSDRTGLVPEGYIEAPEWVAPGCTFDGSEFAIPAPLPPRVPESVSARQFKLQLLAAGLLDDVEAWITAQDRAIQIAYANSGSFVRTEPMMQAGFAALGFAEEQIDAFFTAATAL